MASRDEHLELAELRQLIGSSPTRESTLAQSTYMRWQVGEENRRKADESRKEKEDRVRLKEELDASRLRRATELKRAATVQLERDKLIKQRNEADKLEQGRLIRATEAAWQEKREAAQRRKEEAGRRIVSETKERAKRMNLAEAAHDKLERDDGTRERVAIEKAYMEEREATLEMNRKKVAAVKKATDPALIEKALAWATQKRTGSAEDKRRHQAGVAQERQKNRAEHLAKARATKAQVCPGAHTNMRQGLTGSAYVRAGS